MTISVNSAPHLAAAKINQICPDFKPTIGIVLGSGLGDFAEQLEDTTIIQYAHLEGFPKPTVHGHTGNLILGYINNVGVMCLQGRAHSYEGIDHAVVKNYVRTIKLMGCEYFLATNASGSLREEAGPGQLMLITDHINLQGFNPLVGPNEDEFGSRFFPLDQTYDVGMREKLLKIAQSENIKLNQGVYLAVLGPNYETAAEIRAFRTLGADAVGMSTVPEVLVATHCGMKVAVIATITNYATGLNKEIHSHEAVVKMATQAGIHLNHLLTCFIKTLA